MSVMLDKHEQQIKLHYNQLMDVMQLLPEEEKKQFVPLLMPINTMLGAYFAGVEYIDLLSWSCRKISNILQLREIGVRIIVFLSSCCELAAEKKSIFSLTELLSLFKTIMNRFDGSIGVQLKQHHLTYVNYHEKEEHFLIRSDNHFVA